MRVMIDVKVDGGGLGVVVVGEGPRVALAARNSLLKNGQVSVVLVQVRELCLCPALLPRR